MNNSSLPPVFVPSVSALKKMKTVADNPRQSPIELGKENALVLLQDAYPHIDFSARIIDSQRYGKTVRFKWPQVSGAPSAKDVKDLLSCFESRVGMGPYAPVLPNDEGLTSFAFQQQFGSFTPSLTPWRLTPKGHQVENEVARTAKAKVPRPR